MLKNYFKEVLQWLWEENIQTKSTNRHRALQKRISWGYGNIIWICQF
jgi:hypothetical protein